MSNLFKSHWRNPITFIAVFILVTVILLIAANVLGFDKGETLMNLSHIDFARGLITYLFAVGTIGVVIIVILAILLSGEETEEMMKRAKDILTILIGLFGTIIGFYFGSQSQSNLNPIESSEISIAPVLISQPDEKGAFFNLKTVISGGTGPYTYWIIGDSIAMENETEKIIDQKIKIPQVELSSISIFVEDKLGQWGKIENDINLNKE